MPAHKRSVADNLKDDEESSTLHLHQHHHHHHNSKQSRSEPRPDEYEQGGEGRKASAHETNEEEEEHEKVTEEEEEAEKELNQLLQDEADDYERSPSSSSSEKPEFVFVELSNMRNDVQCPICLGIIKKTRTVMECLHRFCRECIDKSMRMGNNECPACRTHCASRRSLRDDPNYDALIAALYPDIDKYEEEELAFHEEERTRNEQIQASIAQIFQRQSEALIKRRTVGKDTSDSHMTRTQRNHRNARTRRRFIQGVEPQGSEDNDDENENNKIGKDSSSTEGRRLEFRKRKRKKRFRSSQPSSSVANSDGGCSENDLDTSRENRGISPGLAWNSEMLAWGRGGVRSHTRYGNANGCSSKISRSSRLSKLVDYLRSLKENSDELDVHLVLLSLDKNSIPDLQKPYLFCRPSLSVKQLCEYIACQTLLQANEIELLAPRGVFQFDNDDQLNTKSSTTMENPDLMSLVINSCRSMQILKAEETLAEMEAICTSIKDQLQHIGSVCLFEPQDLILVYRRKEICKQTSVCNQHF